MTLDVCRNARANGLDLTFLATGGGDLEEDFRGSDFDFVRLDRKLPVDPLLVSQIRQILQERKIQIVHSHQPVEALHMYFATRESGIKRVMTMHGHLSGLKNEWAFRYIAGRTDAIVAVSNELRSWLKGHAASETNGNVPLIKNGVDPARLQAYRGNLRTELNLPAETQLIGMVANFRPGLEKDQLSVCKALPRVFAANSGAHFLFVGGRSDEAPHIFDKCVDYCRHSKISSRVHFLGKRRDIGKVLASLDVFVLSSRREGSPISVIEAMMMGVPAILSDIGPLREISNNAKCALLFQAGDVEDLATKLIQLLGNSEQRKNLATRARQWAMENFTIKQHVINLTQYYGSLLERSHC
jgi:L-malate glycosyltransferase